MTEFLIYQGKTAIALAVFYIFYRLLLSKETFHRLNRIVLLGTAVLSFVLPFCVITLKEVVVIPGSPAASENVVGEVAGTVAMAPEASGQILPVILCAILVTGALAVLVKVVISIIGIRRIIMSGSWHQLEDKTMVIVEDDIAPFSWMKYIVISREDYESGCEQILTHEMAHIALRHSWDILLVDMITALQWFNPAIWMLKADLRALHEFEADDAVLRSGANIKEYQYLLIRKAVSKSGYSVANSFNHSTLKARITMMLNPKSSRMSAWKALYVIPLVGISLAATAETKVDYRYESQEPLTDMTTVRAKGTHIDKDTEKSWRMKNLKEGKISLNEDRGSMTLTFYDTDFKECSVSFTGLDFSSNVFVVNGALVNEEIFNNAMEHEDVVLMNSYLKNGNKVRAAVYPSDIYITGKVAINDQRKSDTDDIAIVRIGSREDQDDKADVSRKDLLIVVNGEKMPEDFDFNTINPNEITSMTVLKTEKALQEYGTDKGVIVITTDPSKANEKKPVPDIYIDGKKATSEEVAALPANPKGTVAADGTIWITTKEEPEVKSQHSLPTFNGGTSSDFSKWVQANIRYPEGTSAEGRVSVSFTVSETGKVTDVKVLRGLDQKLNDEAVRVISSSPLWSPGIKDGKPVAINLVIPVQFKK